MCHRKRLYYRHQTNLYYPHPIIHSHHTLTINPDTYNLYLRTQANELATATFTYTTPPAGTVCRNADPYSDCIVDIDENMIPIYYDGNTEDGEAIWKVANPTVLGQWYDYTNKQWANAVTVKADKLADYQNPDTTIDNNDVLGYWVYIPRYAYEVQRPNAVDRVVKPQNFNIRFETEEDTKKIPASSCNLGIETAGDMWDDEKPSGNNSTNASNAGPNSDNVKAKDYRTTCVNESGGAITRDYPDNNAELANGHTTWATHPAFGWLDSEGNGTELNGIWVGKFETTGTRTNPTVKPNQHANVSETIGNFYTMARSIGVGTYDPANNGGNPISGIEQNQNSHNLNTTTSHMLKNSEWGAVAYLASSIYGAGTNNVSINSAYPSKSTDADGYSSGYGITGCGPYDINRSINRYDDGTPLNSTTIESPAACSTTNKERSYNGEIGVLASTTNNVYGIYDMSGGAYEYVMGNLTSYNDQSESSDVSFTINPIKPPYVDIYLSTDFSLTNKPDWSASAVVGYYSNDICTWDACGGHALHEAKLYQSVSSSYYSSWGSDYSSFARSYYRWFLRGGSAGNVVDAGLFGSSAFTGSYFYHQGFRAVLSP